MARIARNIVGKGRTQRLWRGIGAGQFARLKHLLDAGDDLGQQARFAKHVAAGQTHGPVGAHLQLAARSKARLAVELAAH